MKPAVFGRQAARSQPHVGEHDDEAAPGLPAPLPPGETLLWRGAPDAALLARRSFHLHKLAVYFAVLIAWRGLSTFADGGGLAAALGLVMMLAWLVARTTVYTLTDRRVVMRVGIVLTVTFNLPLRRIDTVRLRSTEGQAGDVALVLHSDDRIGYLHLWPHARPWRFARTEPMLRALPDAGAVAELLADALAQSTAPLRTQEQSERSSPARARPALPAAGRPPLANAA